MSKTRRNIGLALLALTISFGATACFGSDNGTGDAPVAAGSSDRPWNVIQAPDGFANLATQCNPVVPGTRIYVVTHSKTDVQPLIVTDESCK